MRSIPLDLLTISPVLVSFHFYFNSEARRFVIDEHSEE